MALKNKKENFFLMEAPDKGRSWIIAVACCLIYMLFFGTTGIGSLLYVAIVKSLNVSRKEASLPFSLASALRSFCGPLVGFLADRFGVRLITLTGGILAALGIGMCFFTHRIIPITVFWSLGFGMGFSMGVQLLPAIINEYFDKYRARAIGISLSGGCLGNFIFPLLVEFCLREYDLSGTFLIFSGVVLNCVPLALLLRKPAFISKNAHKECTTSHFTDEYARDNFSLENGDTSCAKVNVGDLNTMIRENMKENNFSSPATNSKIPFPEITQFSSLAGCEFLSEKSKNYSLHDETNTEKNETSEDKNIFTITGNVQFHAIVNEKSENSELSDIIKTNALEFETRSERNYFRKNMTLFRNPMFLFIGVSRALYMCAYLSTNTVLADFANDISIEVPKLPYILMSVSVGDFLGRISLGSLIDKGYMTVMQYTATFFLLQALSIASLSWATGFRYLVATSFAYGICGSALMLSSPLLIAECIETKLQIIAMPSFDFFSGFTILAIPKLIEIFREQMGSYVGLFYTTSGISLICATTWLIVLFYLKHRS